MTEQKVSYRYAKAIIDAAKNDNLIEEIRDNFEALISMIIQSKDLKNLIMSPLVQVNKKKMIFEEILKGKTSPLFLNFLLLITEKRRENLIFVINDEFYKIYNASHNILPITITTANALDSNLSDTIITKLNEWTEKNVVPTYLVDKSIKGGIKVKIEDWVFDASLKTKLQSLYSKLANA